MRNTHFNNKARIVSNKHPGVGKVVVFVNVHPYDMANDEGVRQNGFCLEFLEEDTGQGFVIYNPEEIEWIIDEVRLIGNPEPTLCDSSVTEMIRWTQAFYEKNKDSYTPKVEDDAIYVSSDVLAELNEWLNYTIPVVENENYVRPCFFLGIPVHENKVLPKGTIAGTGQIADALRKWKEENIQKTKL